MANNEIAEQVTNELVAALERGDVPWVQPWANLGMSRAVNVASNKPYRGINTLILWLAQNRGKFSSSRWLTFKQALDLRGNVRKGEKGTRVIFWKILEKKNKSGETDKFPVMKVYTVFNLDQCENLPEKVLLAGKKPAISLVEEDAMIEDFIGRVGATISYGGDLAAYSPSRDAIVMPERCQFLDTGSFYATMFHEMIHWTGHNNRCKRHLGERFGTSSYAMEELVAEIGSAFLCADFGVQGKLQHPAYVQNWIKVLKGDKSAIFTAAKFAQEASDYLFDRVLPKDAKTPQNNSGEEQEEDLGTVMVGEAA